VVKVGQEIQVKILQLDTENKKAGLSLKETLDKPVDGGYESQADQADIEANTKQQQLTTNLGEQFGELLSKFKK
jgi:small subunit ribosomal protein S1